MNNPDAITLQIIDSIGIITLNDPPANYLSVPEFIPVSLFLEFTSDPLLKGLIITGAGKNFSAGGALDAVFGASYSPWKLENLARQGLDLLNIIQDLDIPVIAAINRVCFGGGLEIALACHIRVASENALIAFPEVNQNLMPGLGGTVRLPALTGLAQSMNIILGGDTVNATDAKVLGIVDFIAPRDNAYEYAWSLMKKMTNDRPVKVIRSIMKALKNAAVSTPEEALKAETLLFCSLASDEALRRQTGEA
jgi:enoyl-CoA hydratase/carnithine racemase